MVTKSILKTIQEVKAATAENPELGKMFENTYPNTLATTVQRLEDGTSFVITGDIPAMWLRDSTAQVRHYLPNAKKDAALSALIAGVIRRQLAYVCIDPYANAFNREPNGNGHSDDLTDQNRWVWERKYEVDSLCAPIQLAYLFWKETGCTDIFDGMFHTAAEKILNLWILEQHHENSAYSFERQNCPQSDTLSNSGKGSPVVYTGMTWSGFRPSDDACTYGYLIPANMFAVVVLRYLAEIAGKIYYDYKLKENADQLACEIERGISEFGTVNHPIYGKIYAYETDGMGHYNLMDDANVPSLLSLPYLGYCSCKDSVYVNTRKFILSRQNPFYFDGNAAKGIGSPHTKAGYIWPIALAMQGLTAANKKEREEVLKMLVNTDSATGFIHESFDCNCPERFTRPWFAWANSLFSEFVLKYVSLNS